jgi:hypothetical protein
MIEEIQIKILRLNTGEDIIGLCLNDMANGSIEIESPMRVIVKRMVPAGRTLLLMSPWLPLELVEDDSAVINHADIITIINPNNQFVEYYTNTVTEYKEKIMNEEEFGIMDDTEDFDFGDEEYEENEEESLNEINEAYKEAKKGTLH